MKGIITLSFIPSGTQVSRGTDRSSSLRTQTTEGTEKRILGNERRLISILLGVYYEHTQPHQKADR